MGAGDRGPQKDEGETGGGRRRRIRVTGLLKAALHLALAAAVLAVTAFFFLTRTGPGQRWVVGQVLERVAGGLGGTVTIRGVRSPDLLDGVVLQGVSIVGPDGRPFLEVDSVAARYSVPELIAGPIAFSDVVVHRPRVRVATLPGDERSNVSEIFGDAPAADSAGAGAVGIDSSAAVPAPAAAPRGRGREVVLRGVRIVEGSLEILQPVEGEAAERAVVVDGPGGGRLRKIAATGIAAELSRAVLVSPRVEGVEVSVTSLALDARIFQDPLRVEDLRGLARWRDGTLSVEADALRLPGSDLGGLVEARLDEPGGAVFAFDLEAAPLALEDVRWAEPRLPPGTVRGGVGLTLGPDVLEGTFRDARAELGPDRIRADGGVALVGSRVRFDGLDLRLDPLDLERLRPWTDATIPVDGSVRGTLSLEGPADGMRTSGELTYMPPGNEGAATTVALDGVVRVGEDPGATDLRATFDPLDYRTLFRVLGDSVGLGGRGRATVDVTGRLSDGVRFTAELVHRMPDLPTSRVVSRGSLRRSDGDLVLDVQGDVSPFSFTTLRSLRADLPVTGEVSGSVRARGPLSALDVTAMLDTEAGRLDLRGHVDARRPADGYRVEGTVEDVPLSRFVPALAGPSLVSGEILLEGSGLSPDSARARGRVLMRPSTVGGVPVDTLEADFRVADGFLALDTLQVVAVGVGLQAGGRIPFRPGEEEGVVRVGFVADSLEGFRRLVRGDRVIARDTLEGLELDVVEASGVDLDTLPLLEEVAVDGRMEGELVVQGSLEDFRVDGEARLEEVVWGTSFVRGARLQVEAAALPGLGGRVEAILETDSMDVADRHFRSSRVVVDYTRPRGTVEVLLTRSDDEDYRARATVEADSLGGRVEVEELALRFDTVTWSLQAPAAVRWDDDALHVDELVVARAGPEAMRIRADGRFPRRGDADFTLDVDGLHLPRATRMAQMEELGLEGVADLTFRVTGTASSPVIHGDVTARDLSYGSWDLGLLLGSFDYRDLRTAVDLRAWRGDLQVLVATGTVPLDLRLVGVEDRVPDDRTMDVRVVADSLPAAFAVTLLENLEDVTGTIAGDFRIGGSVEAPSPTGTLAIENAAWTLTALGVRQEDIQGTLTLEPDGTVAVDARARAEGTAGVTGTVGLEPLDDPTFDLVLTFDDFRAIDRRDMVGVVSGEVTLTGSFRQPLVQGQQSRGRGLSARGDLYVEEFQRSASVIDLSSPRFADFLDESFLAGAQPILAESRNPFLEHLRVEVDVTVERDTWLRSSDMNVEIAGNLGMTYHRQQRDLVLQGTLQAIRGSYTPSTLGRRFEVRGGTVEFVGTPGVNPNLSIEASTRVRRPEGDPLDITATLTGTLSNPRLQLSSDEQAVAQEDLVSYLVWGRPSYELTSGQAQGVQEASELLNTTVATGLSAFSGTLTSRISTLLGQRFGLDYFAISSGSLGLSAEAASGALAQTTVELGGYFGEELFWVLSLRPAGIDGSNTLGSLRGVRLEWQATDLYKVEAFIDDRFLRSGAIGFRELALRSSKVYGLNVFREWTY